MIGKNTTLYVVTGVLVACAAVTTAANVREAYVRSRRPPTMPADIVPDWRSYGSVGHRLGPPDAKVVVTVFSDYQCSACRKMARRLDALRQQHYGAIAVVMRHLPLGIHPYARAAAQAAECADMQGKFERFNDVLFSQAESVGDRPWTGFALDAGVPDTAAFARCLRDAQSAGAVDADIHAAERLGLFATPTIIINDELYIGGPWDLERIIERHLEAATGSVRS